MGFARERRNAPRRGDGRAPAAAEGAKPASELARGPAPCFIAPQAV